MSEATNDNLSPKSSWNPDIWNPLNTDQTILRVQGIVDKNQPSIHELGTVLDEMVQQEVDLANAHPEL